MRGRGVQVTTPYRSAHDLPPPWLPTPELMLALNELLYTSPAAEAGPGAPAAGASGASVSSGLPGVLVLATTATPGALDEPLMAALGRTAVLHMVRHRTGNV